MATTLLPSRSYSNLLGRFESISGAVPGQPGLFTWYYDSVGVPTLGYGHALHHPVTGKILHRSEYGAQTASLADQAVIKYYGTKAITMAQVIDLKAKDMASFADDVQGLVRPDTSQAQYDMLVDFSYNLGVAALKGSTLLKMHNSGKASLGTTDVEALATRSKTGHALETIGDAFAAWSKADHKWSLGVYHRRACEFLIYSGVDYNDAYLRAWRYHE